MFNFLQGDMNIYLIKQTDNYKVTKNKSTGMLFFQFFLNKNNTEKYIKSFDLINKISCLPDENLKALLYTPDLEKTWRYERLFSQTIALYILIKDFNLDEKLIREITTDDIMLSLIEAIVGRYQAIRKLIKVGFPILKKYFSECSEEPEDLVYQIIKEERNLSFESKLIYDFVQYEPSQLAKIHTELAKKNITVDDLEKLEKLKPIHTRGSNTEPSLFIRIIDSLNNNSDRTPILLRSKISHCYDIYNETTRYENEVLAIGFSGRTNKNNFIPTVTYNKGVVSYTKYGRK